MDASYQFWAMVKKLRDRGMIGALWPPDPGNRERRNGLGHVPTSSELGRVLGTCNGFELTDGTTYSLRRWSSYNSMFPGLFPATLQGFSDGYGNTVIPELNSSGTIAKDVFYICHDPPVMVRSCAEIGHLFVALTKLMYTETDADARADQAAEAYTRDSSVTEAYCARLASIDPSLRRWLDSLPSERRFFDLALERSNNGVRLDVFGANSNITRYRSSLLFAVTPLTASASPG